MHFLATLALATAVLGQSVTVLPPSQDPFYVPPTGYEKTLPGTVLRLRQAPGNLSSLFNASAAYHILYRTTDSSYNATTAVQTVFVPRTGDASKFLQYSIPYDSADVDASPSYALYKGPNKDILSGLSRGWYVGTSDYEGPLASFTAGVMSGHATLDAVRATKATGFGLKSNATAALWGYSGGALASEWALELQVQYAPELSLAGAALGGLTPNVTSVLLAVNGNVTAGLIPAGIIGLASQYPGGLDYLISGLKKTGPRNATGFLAARNYTLVQAIVAYAGQDITDYFVGGIAELMMPLIQKITNRDGIMGAHGFPQFPVFAYKAIGDELSPVADTDRLIARYCALGADIQYDRNTIGTHASESDNGAPRALAFLTQALSGSLNQTGCAIRNVTVQVPAASS